MPLTTVKTLALMPIPTVRVRTTTSGEQRVAADDAAAVAHVFPEGGEEDGGIAAVFGDLLFPGLRQEAAGGDEAGGEHLGRALRGGGRGGVVFALEGMCERHDVGFERFLPEDGILGPLRAGACRAIATTGGRGAVKSARKAASSPDALSSMGGMAAK